MDRLTNNNNRYLSSYKKSNSIELFVAIVVVVFGICFLGNLVSSKDDSAQDKFQLTTEKEVE